MKTYEIVEDEQGSILKVTEGDSVWWVEVDGGSTRWEEYLRYTAWLDEGNDPDEFWNNEEL
jgi:hypothetical protein